MTSQPSPPGELVRARRTRPARSWFGSRAEWIPAMPARPRRPTPSAAWIGPAVVLATIGIPWLAFAGTPGEDGDVSLGLYVGALAITAMSWSFLLAVRIRRAEWLFGGLDRM